MRWIERAAGLAAGLLALLAGLASFQLPAARIVGETTYYGPGISDQLHATIALPVVIAVAAALATAVFALLDARRSGRNYGLTALTVLAVVVCALAAGWLLAGNIALVFAAPSVHGSGLIEQYNAGALFIPTLVAAACCALAAIWPRPPQPTTSAPRAPSRRQ